MDEKMGRWGVSGDGSMLPNQHKLNGSCRKQNDIRRLKGGSPMGLRGRFFATQGRWLVLLWQP